MQGLLIKGVGGLYTVYCDEDRQLYPAKARGKFRKEGQIPTVGDRVSFTPAAPGDDFGAIDEIFPRKNRLVRPAVANIDLLFVVMALHSPEPDLLMCDKLLFQARMCQMETIVVINKADLGDAGALAAQYESCGIPVLQVSAQKGRGIDELLSHTRGKICALAGQSAVGKSSLLNALGQGFALETGSVSRIERGRHTTRHVELLPLGENSWLADTPGFSLLEIDLLDPDTLKTYYPEFAPYEENCRFAGCNHIGEKGCAVYQAAQNGLIGMQRLARYKELYIEMKEKWKRRYD